jgi:hypothetical protein
MGVFFAITGAIIIAIGFLVHLRAQAKGRKAQLWPTTKGAVLTSDVAVVQMMGNPMSTPAVTYSYEVGGRALQGNGLRVGAPRLFNKPDKAAALAAQYPVGSQVTVHYDPATPTNTALDLAVGEGYGPLMIYSFGGTLLVLGIFSAAMGL